MGVPGNIRDRGAISVPTNVNTATTTNSGNNSHGMPSLTYDGNSKCTRLTPLLSWNYASRLLDSAYWYETMTNGVENDYIPSGNKTTVITVPITATEYTANICGLATNAAPVGITFTPADGSQMMGKRLKVYGSGSVTKPNTTKKSYEDNQSAKTANHNVNVFVPTQIDNAWREVPIFRFIGDLNPADRTDNNYPTVLIGPNPLYFSAATDPSLSVDRQSLFNNCAVNLGNEYELTQSRQLAENASFALAIDIPKHYDLSNGTFVDDRPYFRVYWSKYAFQIVDCVGQFCPDTGDSDKTKWVWISIPEFHFVSYNVLVFEVVGHHIVITNVTKTGDHDKADKRPSFGYMDPNTNPKSEGLVVPTTQLKIGLRAVDIRFAYVPVVYPPHGSLFVSNMQTGYSIQGLHMSSVTDTTNVSSGGNVLVSIIPVDVAKGTFSYSIKISRGATPDVTPALYQFELVAEPNIVSVPVSPFQTEGRLRQISVSLGVESQSGTITLDNRDGALSRIGGVIPCSISGGWNSITGGALQPAVIFNGYINTSQCTKSASQSTATFNLIGADQSLKDAIGINLPIYDGFDDGEAVQDLLNRAGWRDSINIEGGYQLSVPDTLTPPSFKFAMGRSIMDCIRDIATHAGKWAFVDNFGTFNYITQRSSYGAMLGTFKEVPSAPGTYDEWLALGSVKVFNELNNAVLVIGLDSGTSPIVAIRTDSGSAIGDMLSDTYLGWLKWVVYQDAKINSAEAAQGIAERLFVNNNRGRITATGRVWGNPNLVPWKKIQIELETDDIGVPPNAQWRILSANHVLDANDGSYFVDLEVEYVDPRYNYTSWWE